MSISHICCFSFALALSLLPSVADEPAPITLPPVVGTAWVSKAPEARDGLEREIFTVSLSVPEIMWDVVGEVVPKSQWPELKLEVEDRVIEIVSHPALSLRGARFVNLEGNDLPTEQVLARLKQKTRVLVAVDSDMPSAEYLELIKPDTLLILLGPRDGAPAPNLLPYRKGTAFVPDH